MTPTLNRAITIFGVCALFSLALWLVPEVKGLVNVVSIILLSLSALLEINGRSRHVSIFVETESWYKRIIDIIDKYSFSILVVMIFIDHKFGYLSIPMGILGIFMIYRFITFGPKVGYVKEDQ